MFSLVVVRNNVGEYVHFGDWPNVLEKVLGLCYYEKYGDGDYSLFIRGINADLYTKDGALDTYLSYVDTLEYDPTSTKRVQASGYCIAATTRVEGSKLSGYTPLAEPLVMENYQFYELPTTGITKDANTGIPQSEGGCQYHSDAVEPSDRYRGGGGSRMMSRSFTKREKILMLCLAVVILAAVYLKVVYIDVSNTMEQYPTMLAEAEEELSLGQQKYGKLQAMRQELDALKESGAELQAVPNYDNSKKIMEELNQILRPCQDYSLNFLPLEQQGNIIRRKIDLQFICSNYGTAEQVVRDIDEMQYRYLITSLSMQGRDTIKTGEVTTRLEATFFELSEEVIVAPKGTESD